MIAGGSQPSWENVQPRIGSVGGEIGIRAREVGGGETKSSANALEKA